MAYRDGVTRLGLAGGPARQYAAFAASASAAITGTLDGATEAQVVSGGLTTIITLTADTWVAAGATFNAQRQNIIDGVTSAQSEATGWNLIVRDNEAVTSVVRTSDTVVTITWSAAPSYLITADEVITVTVPATALTGAAALTGAPTVTITDLGKVVRGRFRRKRRYLIEIDGEFFDVRNQAEAQVIFDNLRETAEEQADTDVPVKPVKISVKTGTGKVTKAQGMISAVRQAKQSVNRAIERQAARLKMDREISNLMVAKIEEERDEEESLLMLLLS